MESYLPADVCAELKGARALVTGGTGMIGRQVVGLLRRAGAHVVSASLDDIAPYPGTDLMRGDLTDMAFCLRATAGMDFVFHVAGVKGSVVVTLERPASFFVPLLQMNTNVLEAARRNGVPRLVYTSSIGAYSSAEVFREDDHSFESKPMDQFPGWAKRMAELQIEAYRIEHGLEGYAIVRPANVYGPGDNFDPKTAMVVGSLIARIAAGENPVHVWGDGSAVRDLVYSGDVATGIVLACVRGAAGGFVNLGGGGGVSIRRLVETLQKVTPFEAHFDVSKPSGFPRRVMDISRAQKVIGYQPATGLEEGLRRTWTWYVANRDEHRKKVNYFAAAS